MGLFRRRTPSESGATPGITEFWRWWSQAHPSVPDTGELSTELTGRLDERVTRMNSELDWEVTGLPDGRHALTVTGHGRDDLRAIAERWYRSAPEDERWEFRPAVTADRAALDSGLSIDGHELEPSHLLFGVRVDTQLARADMLAYHPDFLFLPEETRQTIVRRALALALGEDEVSRWIGTIDTAEDKPLDGLPVGSLPAVVRQLAESQGAPGWLSGKGRTARGRAAVIRVRFPLRKVDHPLCDLHVLVSVPYQNANPERLPVDPSASALREFGEALEGIGEQAMLAAYETGDDHRMFHVYADPQSSAVAEIDQLAAGWREGRVRVTSRPDPDWTALGPYRL